MEDDGGGESDVYGEGGDAGCPLLGKSRSSSSARGCDASTGVGGAPDGSSGGRGSGKGRGREEEEESDGAMAEGGTVGAVETGPVLPPAAEDEPVRSMASTRGSCDDRLAEEDMTVVRKEDGEEEEEGGGMKRVRPKAGWLSSASLLRAASAACTLARAARGSKASDMKVGDSASDAHHCRLPVQMVVRHLRQTRQGVNDSFDGRKGTTAKRHERLIVCSINQHDSCVSIYSLTMSSVAIRSSSQQQQQQQHVHSTPFLPPPRSCLRAAGRRCSALISDLYHSSAVWMQSMFLYHPY